MHTSNRTGCAHIWPIYCDALRQTNIRARMRIQIQSNEHKQAKHIHCDGKNKIYMHEQKIEKNHIIIIATICHSMRDQQMCTEAFHAIHPFP